MELEQKAVNTIRMLAVDAVEKAKSGHPGLPMGGAEIGYTLWRYFLKHSPQNPNWPDRDRFVLSAGHGSMLLYALLHLFGYDLSLEEIKNFRQWGSATPGHPEVKHTPGVETTTGPLGQGFANGVGMAIAQERLAQEFNCEDFKLIDHYTYVYAGDGCMMEGVTQEAASIAGHLKLNKLICLYDDNQITIDGSTDLTFTEDVAKRFEAYNWQVIKVEDGHSVESIKNAIALAKEDKERPTLIMVNTIIGYGSPEKAGLAAAHGAPLGEEEVEATRKNLKWLSDQPFHIPDQVKDYFEKVKKQLNENEANWQQMFTAYCEKYPQKGEKWHRWHQDSENQDLKQAVLDLELQSKDATRNSSGKIMQVISEYQENFCGGSADLNASTKTYLQNKSDFNACSYQGNNIYFGVREHAMGAIINGMALHGGLKVFCSTFLVFADYMKAALRMAAISKIPCTFVFTHDSIAVGEDGPTHQPIDQLPMLRAIPNFEVLRPADSTETKWAWLYALSQKETPTALILSRQGLPQLKETGEKASLGAYICCQEQGEKLDLILMASGSELHLAIEAFQTLTQQGYSVRVVSMMSWELFLKQSNEYQKSVLPKECKKRVAIEAGSTLGWQKFVGDDGVIIGIDDFGASASGQVVMEQKGITVANILQQSQSILKR